MMSLAEFEAKYANTYVDFEGHFGNQCWDLAQLYYTLCVNPAGTLWTVPGAQHPGYASGSWEGFAVNGLGADFVQISPDQPTQAGDIVICAWGSATYPVSHVFLTLADAGNLIYGLSQNSSPARPDLPGYSPKSSGPTVRQYLPKDRIAGYLRPRVNVTGQASDITPIEEDFLMALSDDDQNELLTNLRKLVHGQVALTEAVAKIDTRVVLVEDRARKYIDSPISAVPKKVLEESFEKKGTEQTGMGTVGGELAYLAGNFKVVNNKIDALRDGK